jgi:Flp pilus assembly CpaF family ATPase
MLGWRILKEGEYQVGLPVLSREEEEIISAAEAGFREATRSQHAQTREEAEALIRELLVHAAEGSGVYLDRSQGEYLGRAAAMHIYGFAFLDVLVGDPEIEEISVIGTGKPAYVYLRGQGWKRVNASFDDERTMTDVINKMARNLGRHITLQNPRLDAMLPDGSRLHASLSPVSQGEITIRKFRERPFSPRELVENGTVPAGALALLSALMQCDCSVLIAGNTASGKTTTMNSLFSFTPGNERVLIAEETPEINIPHRHQLRLVANRDMGITLKDLMYDSLRMRPDRMIVGEVRNRDEVEALFDVLLAGQARGSYATLHAQSVGEALSRLRAFGIADMDLRSVDCMVIQRRMLLYDQKKRTTREVRRVVEIAEIGKSDGRPRTLYAGGKLAPIGRSAMVARVAESFGISTGKMAAELGRRTNLIMKAGRDYGEFYKTVQKDLYGLQVCGGPDD